MNDLFAGFGKENLDLFKKLNTPAKIQDFINSLEINFEEKGETCNSPKIVLENRKAHCTEGAFLAAAILRYHGFEPLIVDMVSNQKDFDHLIAVFKIDGMWGAIGKTNHAVLRYREPIYRDIRELIMSYFHEYFLNSSGEKTLREYSEPINLKRFDKVDWMTKDDELWEILDYLTEIKHNQILTRKQVARLRKADDIEIEAGKLVEKKGKEEVWK